jgi:hypothetical protein
MICGGVSGLRKKVRARHRDSRQKVTTCERQQSAPVRQFGGRIARTPPRRALANSSCGEYIAARRTPCVVATDEGVVLRRVARGRGLLNLGGLALGRVEHDIVPDLGKTADCLSLYRDRVRNVDAL